MEEFRHTITDLYQMQSLSLNGKVRMTQARIRAWVDEYGTDGVYVSFSGGKDSTVLLHLVREIYPDVKAVFVDTGLEYPEIREFVKTFDNVEWLKPKLTFRQVIEKYGYPFISKEVSECVYGAKKYIENQKNGGVNLTGTDLINYSEMVSMKNQVGGVNHQQDTNGSLEHTQGQTNQKYKYELDKLTGEGKYQKIPQRTQMLLGIFAKDGQQITENIPSKDYSAFNCERYKFFLEDGAPPISNQCCNVMKKSPVHSYHTKTGRNPMLATMASESRLRTQSWLKTGCNAFESKRPQSTPMAFWTEQDVLLYIKENNLPTCSVYGSIVEDYAAEGQVEGQMDLSDYGLFEKQRPVLKTTGCDRTGCMFCGFGCHLEKSPNRFEKMKETHPKQYEYIMRPWDEGGLGYKEVIDWINEHGNLHIKY